jgi:hypothetical protein
LASVSPSHRPGCARLGFARLKAFRLNVYEAWLQSTVDGVVNPGGGQPGTGLRIEGAAIQHVLNEQTDTASFRARGFTPVAGQTLQVFSGDATDPAHALFGGRILETTLVYEDVKQNVAYDLRCVDPTWLLQRQLVLATYTTQSATAIVLDLVARYTRSVTTRHVAPGLPVLDAITFTNEQVPACLTEICRRIGGYWYLDYSGDLHVFLTETETAAPITDAQPRTSRNHTLREDLSQVVTKVIGRGGGVGVSLDLPAGQVEIPVEEGDEPQSWYAPTGGIVEINAQRVTYAGVRGTGATGALVGTGNAPSAAPTPTPTGGSSHTVGATYRYSVTFVTASGETLAGPLGSILIQSFSPIAPPAVSARSRGASAYPPGLIYPGASAFQFMVQIQYRGGAFGPTGPATGSYPWDGNDWEVYIGARSTYTHSDGSSAFYYPLLEPNGPAAPTQNIRVYRLDNAGGVGWYECSGDYFMGSGAAAGWVYQCACSYTTGAGYVFPASGYGSVLVKNVPISKAPGVTSRKLYRTTANGSALKLLTTLNNNTATEYGDTVADAALGAAPPTSDASGIKDDGQVLVGAPALPVSATAPFEADAILSGPTPGGWARTGGMVIRYTGIAGGQLTGIPASGLGAITATIRYGAQVLVQPRLIGIPATGTGALTLPIRKGDTVTIRLEQTDTAAQAAMAERLKLPGQAAVAADGIIELVITDSRLGLVELAAQIAATLRERKDPHRTLTFESRDPSLQVGRLITVNISSPPISGTFRIQRITFSEIAISGGRATVLPLKTVEATNKLYTFADLVRQLRGREGGVG